MPEDPKNKPARLNRHPAERSSNGAAESLPVRCADELVHQLHQWIAPMPSDLFDYLLDSCERPKDSKTTGN
ncbi:MAG: hypothetical protein AAF903_02245 [Pseudomonadota bacterium]